MRFAGELFIKSCLADRSRAAGDGQGAAALEGVEKLALGEGEQHLVAEGGGDGVVKDGRDGRILACFVELGASFRFHARGGVKREVASSSCIIMLGRFY